MYELFQDLIKPELLVLVPVLYIFGSALKESALADKHIPLFLGGIGILLATVFVAAGSRLDSLASILMVLFSGITQGALCAGASVYVNQIVKQAGKEE